MKVIAIKQGYFGVLRQAGDTFEVPQGTKASWFAPAQAAQEAEPPLGGEPEQLPEQEPELAQEPVQEEAEATQEAVQEEVAAASRTTRRKKAGAQTGSDSV